MYIKNTGKILQDHIDRAQIEIREQTQQKNSSLLTMYLMRFSQQKQVVADNYDRYLHELLLPGFEALDSFYKAEQVRLQKILKTFEDDLKSKIAHYKLTLSPPGKACKTKRTPRVKNFVTPQKKFAKDEEDAKLKEDEEMLFGGQAKKVAMSQPNSRRASPNHGSKTKTSAAKTSKKRK
jgi:hypothetical protein